MRGGRFAVGRRRAFRGFGVSGGLRAVRRAAPPAVAAGGPPLPAGRLPSVGLLLPVGLLLAAAAVPPVPPPSNLPVQEALFDQGNRLYQEGDFGGAAASYEAVLEGGFESAEVYYNLGNAHFRLGEIGLAVFNYERAARLNPRGEDIRANLALVGQMLQDRIEPLPRFWVLSVADWWMALIPRGWLRPIVALGYLALGVTAALLILGRPRGWNRALRRTVYACVAATVLLGGTLLVRETGLGRPEEAVVMSTEARVLSAPSEEGGLTVFTVHEGTKVRIDRRAEDWAEIVLADGKVGWLPLNALEII